MSPKEDPVRRALSGFSLYTLAEKRRQGSLIAVLGRELERYDVRPASVVIANEGASEGIPYSSPLSLSAKGRG